MTDDILGGVVAKFLARGAEVAADGMREERGAAVRRNGATEGQSGVVEYRRVERKRKDMVAKWEVTMVIYTLGRMKGVGYGSTN